MKALFQVSLLVLLAGIASAAESVLPLTREGRALMPLVLPESSDPVVRRAARDLADMLRELSGAEFEIISEEKAGEPAIHVGATRRSLAVFGEEWPVESESWAHRIRADGVFLAGADVRGLLYGIDHWLEETFGVRWWTPHESTIPAWDELQVEYGSRTGRPAFRYRDVYAGSDEAEFAVHMRWNGGFNRGSPRRPSRLLSNAVSSPQM